MKILIVDNDKNTVETLKASLEGNDNMEVDVAYGGAAALELMNVSPFYDVVILDIMMPEVSGIEVCRTMSDNEKLRGIPVLLISALPIESNDFQQSMDKFKELKVVQGVLEKPFSREGLLDKIRSVTYSPIKPSHKADEEALKVKKPAPSKSEQELENEKFFCQIISDIIIRMRNRVGFAALEIAEKIDGLTVDSSGRVVKVEKDPTEIIALLVLNYEKYFYEKVFLPSLWASEGEKVNKNIEIVKKYFKNKTSQ
jgi:CheY-like chemotaxis protein